MRSLGCSSSVFKWYTKGYISSIEITQVYNTPMTSDVIAGIYKDIKKSSHALYVTDIVNQCPSCGFE